MDSPATCDAWARTIASLQDASRSPTDADAENPEGTLRRRIAALRLPSRSGSDAPFSGCIKILERLSSTAVSLCWYDATFGHYADQVWKRTNSRRKTVCSLSGRPVKRGDAVYRPGMRGKCPANAHRSILAAALEAREAQEAASGR